MAERDQGRDDRPRTSPEDEAKLLVEGTPDHRLDLFQNTESVKALGAPAV
jgi:hypothetical protein